MNYFLSCIHVLGILAAQEVPVWSAEATESRSKPQTNESMHAKKTVGSPVVMAPVGGSATPALSTEQLLYQYLLSEIAGQRGRPVVATRGMLDLAQKTSDPRIARRAAEIAFQSRHDRAGGRNTDPVVAGQNARAGAISANALFARALYRS